MYHSITFGIGDTWRNTWDDWHLVSKERPYIAPPELKTQFVDIPGASSKLDFSEELTGYPLYSNRTGSIEFYILNGLDNIERKWFEIYSDISNFVHNKKLQIVLEDDPNYFYEGRLSVESYQPGNSASDPRSTITISYDLYPYKLNVELSDQTDWLWDPFDFVNDIIRNSFFSQIPLKTTSNTLYFNHRALIGYAPFTLKFLINTTNNVGANLTFVNQDIGINKMVHIPDGETEVRDFIVYGLNSRLIYSITSGTGTMSIIFREGRL